MDRKVKAIVRGRPAVDGAGVHMTRVLSRPDAENFDPFLMLDSFDSRRPSDYMAGFPFHPHRGIETLTYLLDGAMEHRDSMGNEDVIGPGEAQWMTAGSGIMHEEMPHESDRMLGFQLWINLPAKDKMAQPHYRALTAQTIPSLEEKGLTVRILSGEYGGKSGFRPLYLPARILDVAFHEADSVFSAECQPENNMFIFTLLGEAEIGGQVYPEKSALLMGEGDRLCLSATAGARIMVFEAPRLDEPVAWGGPIVMNTTAELQEAFAELSSGRFIKDKPD